MKEFHPNSKLQTPNSIWLGRMDYNAAWQLQKRVHGLRVANQIADTLLFVEHDPVISYGSAFDPKSLLYNEEQYREKGIQVIKTDRGGDVTFHGPNQLVIYPIFDIREHGGDLHKWLRDLEETMIQTLAQFGLEGYRFPPHTGVWVNNKKAAAIGIKVSRWVSLHGIALNCNNDLSPFDLIVPCGITGYGVTSLSSETGKGIGIADAIPAVISSFSQVFNMRFGTMEAQTLVELANGATAET
jgi:lipoyl(octanoyl) transferase